MTFSQDEKGNLSSNDFQPHLMTDEELINRWAEAEQALAQEFPNVQPDNPHALILLLCSTELEKRGYTLNDGDPNNEVRLDL